MAGGGERQDGERGEGGGETAHRGSRLGATREVAVQRAQRVSPRRPTPPARGRSRGPRRTTSIRERQRGADAVHAGARRDEVARHRRLEVVDGEADRGAVLAVVGVGLDGAPEREVGERRQHPPWTCRGGWRGAPRSAGRGRARRRRRRCRRWIGPMCSRNGPWLGKGEKAMASSPTPAAGASAAAGWARAGWRSARAPEAGRFEGGAGQPRLGALYEHLKTVDPPRRLVNARTPRHWRRRPTPARRTTPTASLPRCRRTASRTAPAPRTGDRQRPPRQRAAQRR